MPPRLEATLLTLAAVATFWGTVGYAQHGIGNVQAQLWMGAAVDGLIWMAGLGITFTLMKLALKRWR